MHPLIRIWIDICLLRAGPQDVPASRFLLSLTLTSYVSVNCVAALPGLGIGKAFVLALIDVMLLVLFMQLALQVRGYRARFVQSLTAITGTGTLFGIVSLPIVFTLPREPVESGVAGLWALLWLGLMGWSLLVLGHILRHALAIPLFAGLLLGLAYTVFSIMLIRNLFPGLL